MIRKLLLPVIATALLAGCATYGYRGGAGDYYYGQPGTQYRVYGSYGYPGYGYPGYYGYPGSYGYYGYGYGAPYWGGYYRYIPARPHGGHHHGGGHGSGDHEGPRPGQGQQPDRPRPPWRDLGNVARPPVVKRQTVTPSAPAMMAPQRTAPVQAAPRVPRVGGWKRDARRNPVP